MTAVLLGAVSACDTVGSFEAESAQLKSATANLFVGFSNIEVDINGLFIVSWEEPLNDVNTYKIYLQALEPGDDYSVPATGENISDRK